MYNNVCKPFILLTAMRSVSVGAGIARSLRMPNAIVQRETKHHLMHVEPLMGHTVRKPEQLHMNFHITANG